MQWAFDFDVCDVCNKESEELYTEWGYGGEYCPSCWIKHLKTEKRECAECFQYFTLNQLNADVWHRYTYICHNCVIYRSNDELVWTMEDVDDEWCKGTIDLPDNVQEELVVWTIICNRKAIPKDIFQMICGWIKTPIKPMLWCTTVHCYKCSYSYTQCNEQ